MKVIFLDIDGVVNCMHTATRSRGVIGIDPYMAFLVGKIFDATDAKLVLSSSWKHWPDGVEEVSKKVWKVYDTTPNLQGEIRGQEIKAWLDAHPDVEKYAILDDESDMLPEQKHFKTSWAKGITEEIAKEVTDYLNS